MKIIIHITSIVQKIIENLERRFAWWKKLEMSKRGWITLKGKHFIFYSYLFYVVIYDAYSGNQEAGDTSKALSMRNWGHQKITLGGLDSGLLSIEKWWIGDLKLEKDHLSPSLIVKIKFCGDQQRVEHLRVVHVKMPSRALQATFSDGKSI